MRLSLSSATRRAFWAVPSGSDQPGIVRASLVVASTDQEGPGYLARRGLCLTVATVLRRGMSEEFLACPRVRHP
jgi:hypothetical protein